MIISNVVGRANAQAALHVLTKVFRIEIPLTAAVSADAAISVSAASNPYSWIKNADASYNVANGVDTLQIRWTGSPQLTLP